MPKFRIELRFDQELGENIILETELSLDKKEWLTQTLDLEEDQYTKLGDKHIHITTIIALEDIPSHNIKQGDAVFRDWDDLIEDTYSRGEKRIVFFIQSYKPLWESGPGYADLQALLDSAYE